MCVTCFLKASSVRRRVLCAGEAHMIPRQRTWSPDAESGESGYRNGVAMVAGVARLRVCYPRCPNSGESGYENDVTKVAGVARLRFCHMRCPNSGESGYKLGVPMQMISFMV